MKRRAIALVVKAARVDSIPGLFLENYLNQECPKPAALVYFGRQLIRTSSLPKGSSF